MLESAWLQRFALATYPKKLLADRPASVSNFSGRPLLKDLNSWNPDIAEATGKPLISIWASSDHLGQLSLAKLMDKPKYK